MDNDFLEIEEENKNKMYIIVGILYFFVVVFSVLLFLGIKNQRDTVKNNLEKNNVKDLKTKSDDNKNNNGIIDDLKKNNIQESIKDANQNKTEKDYENILNGI